MRYVFFLVLSALINQAGIAQQYKSDLTFVYWMPYDNNLGVWADSIYHMINSGLQSGGITVTIQKDVPGNAGMTRSILNKGRSVHQSINDENSSSGVSYNSYLKWVAQNVASKKYVIIFLDHGGKLDQVGLDEFPEENFLRIDSISWAINNFNRRTGKKTELVYLQVCTKGSIEPLYQLKDVSNYTMFSQTLLGAPNFYYEGFFQSLSARSFSEISGLQIAKAIAKSERKDMYESLICIDNSKFQPFNKSLRNFIQQSADATGYHISTNKVLFYYGDTYIDLQSFVNGFSGINAAELLQSLDQLVVMNVLSSKQSGMKGYSGISMLAMQRDYLEKISTYQHLEFFLDFDMKSLFHTLEAIRK